MYLSAVERLPQYGFRLYEISNASRVGCESRHNQKYWDGAEYLGIGPGAHSLFRNERFRMKEGIEAFILASNLRDRMTEVEKRSEEDRFTERVMLSLRTARGLSRQELLHLSSEECVARWDKKFALWAKHGLAGLSSQGYALTPKGFFVSNEIITELLLIPRI
jgi:oxygen-independent coproporphyrinogen-3 oxidase